MGMGEELLIEHAFEIDDAANRTETFYENLKNGIWTNTYGDKIYVFEIDDQYFNNIINYCKKEGIPNGIINKMISIRNDNFKNTCKFDLNEYIVYCSKLSEYKIYKIVKFFKEYTLISDILGNTIKVDDNTINKKYCSYKDSKFLWYWEIYNKKKNVLSTLKDRYTYYDILNYCKKNNCELKKPLILLGYSINTSNNSIDF